MKIKRINLKAFGKFKNESYQFSEDQINLVFGDNEAGKSTLFESFKSLLCGFTPASRDRFPYIPWGEDEAALEMETFQGELIQRRMRSNIQGFYKGSQGTEKIQNRPLFDIDRSLLENLYTLQADDLLDIDKRSMEYVFDELSTTFDVPGMLSPKNALEQLDDRRKSLYTNHAHSGRPLNMIEMELEELKSQLVDIEDSAQMYRKDLAEYDQTEKLSLELAGKIDDLKQEIDRIHHLESKKNDWEQLKKARRSIHQESLSRSLGSEFIDRFKEIDFDVENYAEQLISRKRELERLQQDLDPLEEAEIRFLDEFDDYVSSLQRNESEIDKLTQLIERSTQDKQSQSQRFDNLAMANFVQVPSYENFSYISLSRIRPSVIFPVFLGLVLLGLGYLASLFHRTEFVLARNVTLAAVVIGLGILVYFLYALWSYHRQRRQHYLNPEFNQRDLGEMAQLARQLQEFDHLIDRSKTEIEQIQAEQSGLLERYDFSSSDEVFLRERVLFRKQDRQDDKSDQIARLERELSAVQEKLEYQSMLKTEQIRPLKAYSDEPDRAIDLLQSDLKAIAFYDELQRQWDEDPVAPEDLQALETMPLDELKQQEEALQDLFRQTISQSASARERMRQYEKLKPMEEYRNQIRTLEDRRRDILYEYNSLILLYNLLNQHYRSFIETHQPELLEIASDYLKDFSSNRYHQILTIEEEFYLKRSNGELVKLASSHSKGIRSQLYLALRLAIIDTVEKQQPLPLFFDEAFSNWDNPRLKRTLSVLREIAKHRQVFIFTCRQEDAAMIEAQTACYRIDLNI